MEKELCICCGEALCQIQDLEIMIKIDGRHLPKEVHKGIEKARIGLAESYIFLRTNAPFICQTIHQK